MSILSNTFPERLYLSKDAAADIYVDDCRNLRRNQINSLRGLFNLFKKNVPGAILNNASESGKTVTVVLFIEAIQKLLSDPVLILCNHSHEIQYWNETLLKWTKYTEDNIALEATNPYLKKNIFIHKSMELPNSFFRRNWSLLVLKDDEITKEIGKMTFNAQFKIWITSVDVFKDLKLLSSLAKFINPKININVEDFDINNKNVIEQIKTFVLLQAFTEDLVVRTDDLKSILQKPKEPNKNNPAPVTKKNKDATGTKIKKSKRKLSDDPPNTSASINVNKKASIYNNTNEIKSNKEDTVTNDVDDQDSPSVLNLKSVSRNNTQNLNVTNSNMEHKYHVDDSYNDNRNSKFIDDVTDATDVDLATQSQTFSDHSTQSLTDDSENYVKLVYSEDVEMKDNCEVNNPQNLTNNITNNIQENTTKDLKEAEDNDTETDIYEKDTVDLDTESLQQKLSNIDVDKEINNDQNSEHIAQEPEINNGIIEEVKKKTENVKEKSFDQKMNDLEAQTLSKFRGSILDSIF